MFDDPEQLFFDLISVVNIRSRSSVKIFLPSGWKYDNLHICVKCLCLKHHNINKSHFSLCKKTAVWPSSTPQKHFSTVRWSGSPHCLLTDFFPLVFIFLVLRNINRPQTPRFDALVLRWRTSSLDVIMHKLFIHIDHIWWNIQCNRSVSLMLDDQTSFGLFCASVNKGINGCRFLPRKTGEDSIHPSFYEKCLYIHLKRRAGETIKGFMNCTLFAQICLWIESLQSFCFILIQNVFVYIIKK